jgi:hypothetical protein
VWDGLVDFAAADCAVGFFAEDTVAECGAAVAVGSAGVGCGHELVFSGIALLPKIEVYAGQRVAVERLCIGVLRA